MAGVFGITSKEDCSNDLFLGLHYLQHRSQDYCGIGWKDNDRLQTLVREGLVNQKFSLKELHKLRPTSAIGSVSGDKQPVSEFSQVGGLVTVYDGNLTNYDELIDSFLRKGITFPLYCDFEDIKDTALISKIISKETSFERGIVSLIEKIQGDFAIVSLTKEGIYAARGWGRKPLVLGKKDGSYAVSSESNSFANTHFELVRDVNPGEIVFLNGDGIQNVETLNLSPVKFGTFEWIYTGYPPSVIDGKSVSRVRKNIGRALAKKFPVDADIVSPVPNSGRWHATGFSHESEIPYEEIFVRFDYSDRSYTPGKQSARNFQAKTKLIPVEESIKGKRIVLVDDSIVRGTQMLNRVTALKDMGAKEVHARIACPPLLRACKYGKSTKKDEDCIAKRMSLKKIQETLRLDSLEYALIDILEDAIGYPRDKLCLTCWGAD